MPRRERGNTAVVDPEEAAVTEPEQTLEASDEVEDIAGTPVEPEPEVVDLSGFKAAVDAVIGEENPNYDNVKAEYDKLSRKGKMQATAWIRTQVMSLVEEEEFDKARSFSKVKKYFSSLTPSTTTEAADPSVELVNRIAALRIVNSRLSESEEATKVENLEERVSKAVESPDEKVQAAVSKLMEVRAARKPREPGGTRHNVANHITQVFENVASGEFLDYKQIGEATSAEYEGKASTPSAVKAKLDSGKFQAEGLSVETVNDKIGVRKA